MILDGNGRLAICLVVTVAVAIGLWRYSRDQYEMLDDYVATLEAHVAQLQIDTDTLKRHVLASEKALIQAGRVQVDVRNARVATNKELEAACGLSGDELFNALEWVLETDRERRGGAGVDATGESDGAMCGAGGVGSGD